MNQIDIYTSSEEGDKDRPSESYSKLLKIGMCKEVCQVGSQHNFFLHDRLVGDFQVSHNSKVKELKQLVRRDICCRRQLRK